MKNDNFNIDDKLKKYVNDLAGFPAEKFDSTENFKTNFLEKTKTVKSAKKNIWLMPLKIAMLFTICGFILITFLVPNLQPAKYISKDNSQIQTESSPKKIVSKESENSKRKIEESFELSDADAQLKEKVSAISIKKTHMNNSQVISSEKKKIKLGTFSQKNSAPSTLVFKDSHELSRNDIAIGGNGALIVKDSQKLKREERKMAIETEGFEGITETGFVKTVDENISTFSVDVDTANYALMRRFIETNRQLPPQSSIRIEELVNYFKYDYPQPKNDDAVNVSTEIAACPWNQKNKLARIGVQAKIVDFEKLPPSNLVFLIDISGSMNTENRLPLVKKSFTMLLEKLRPEDRVAIVTYASGVGCPLSSTSAGEKTKILKAINNLNASGSTSGADGIELAYKTAKEFFIKNGNNRVIIATDGDFNTGRCSRAEILQIIEKERQNGIFLTVLGFGMGNYKDDMLEMLANKGNGNYAYIDNILEAKKVMINEFAANLWAVAKDVKLQVDFNPKKVAQYRLIGYENRRLNKQDFADDKKDAGEMGTGHTITALYELIMNEENQNKEEQNVVSRYVETKLRNNTDLAEEIMTINVRYKQPNSEISRLLTFPVKNVATTIDETSDDFRFVAAVAGFGQILRDSTFKGKVNYSFLINLAKNAKGKDFDGNRAEFIRLMEKAETLPQIKPTPELNY